MKAFLMFKDQDFDLEQKLPWNEKALTQDLELNTLFSAMALDDQLLFEVARKTVLSSSGDLDIICYRQNILKDCLNNSSVVNNIYDIAVQAIEREKKHYIGFFSQYPTAILHRATDVLQMFMEMLKKLRNIADEHADNFESEGFSRFFTMLKQELDDEYLAAIQNYLQELKFRDGVLISAKLGRGNEGTAYILRKSDKKLTWIERIFTKKPPVYTFHISDRDEAGARALSELKDRGINIVANALAQSSDHILGFFKMLQIELAFYVGCINLQEQLDKKGLPICFPIPMPYAQRSHSFQGLYDTCLALLLNEGIAGNDVNADSKDLVIITGANQGGKSTYLRSIGLAQLMMQCGMFVTAESFCANVCNGLFTHYKREEDITMTSGKLDEELERMSQIVDSLKSDSLILFNESFAATNEREGSEIGRQIVCALVEKRVKVFFVTHLYEFAHKFYNKEMENAIFLKAQRQPDGERTFKILQGEPLPTSYGEDLYNSIFASQNSNS